MEYSVVVMDSTAYYDAEERRGRRRKNRFLIEQSKNVVDFESFILQKAYDDGGDKQLKKTYEFYVKQGYDRIS